MGIATPVGHGTGSLYSRTEWTQDRCTRVEGPLGQQESERRYPSSSIGEKPAASHEAST